MEKGFKQLRVWQEGIELVKLVYEVTAGFPTEEKYGLISQMRRASISIPSNIAEGAARQAIKDSIQYFVMARSSLNELDTQIEICRILNILNDELGSIVSKKLDAVESLLNGLIRFRKSLL
ncbi:MAG: four helix bundle protein [bacterium]